jgi:hypothetical protein
MRQALFDAFMLEEAKDFHRNRDLRYDDILTFVLAQDGYVTINSYSNFGFISRSLSFDNFIKEGKFHARIDLCSCGKTWMAHDKDNVLIGGRECGMLPLN